MTIGIAVSRLIGSGIGIGVNIEEIFSLFGIEPYGFGSGPFPRDRMDFFCKKLLGGFILRDLNLKAEPAQGECGSFGNRLGMNNTRAGCGRLFVGIRFWV